MERGRIGFQGDVESGGESAARVFTLNAGYGLADVELVPLVTVRGVVDALLAEQIDLGVLAQANSMTGIVAETAAAAQGVCFDLVDRIVLPVHHCVFVRHGIEPELIESVASHERALRQTRKNRARLLPGCREIVVEDTANAAKMLAEGELPEDCAALCRRSAGDRYSLRLLYEDIEDDENNQTAFLVVRICKKN